MKLVLLGTGGYYPNDRRHTACLMLPELGIVLDAGSGIFRVREYLATDRLDVFLTHAHLDHVMGLTTLLDVLAADVLAATTVHAEADKLAAVEQHLFAPAIFPVKLPLKFQPLKVECELFGGGRLRHFPLRHPGGSIGLRFDWPGHSLAYVTDTTTTTASEYLRHIEGVDLLVHEAYFDGDAHDMADVTGHSCLLDVAHAAAAANVGRLVVVHVNPALANDAELDMAAARQVFPNTELGTDRLEIEF